MADNYNRVVIPGPICVSVSASGSTVLERVTRSGVPETADADANPYTSSGGQTRTPLIVGSNLTTSMGGGKVALHFAQANLTTSMSAVAMQVAGVSGLTQIASAWAGSVIGVTGLLNAAITAGTYRAAVSVNGATVFSAINSATGTRTVIGTQAVGVDAIVRGDRIGIKITTSADLAPATPELAAVAWLAV